MENFRKYFERLNFSFNRKSAFDYGVYILIVIVFFGYVVPLIVSPSPYGSDTFLHMANTRKMADEDSLFDFLEKSIVQTDLSVEYPFGMWYFAAIAMKVTGMDIFQISYTLPLLFSLITFVVFFVYADTLVKSKKISIFSVVFYISMPLIAISLLNFQSVRFITIFLIGLLYLSLQKFSLKNTVIIWVLIFIISFSHTGTYMFLIFFFSFNFILFALLWKKIDINQFVVAASLLFIYIIAMNLFPFIQQQYSNKGQFIISIGEKFSTLTGIDAFSEFGTIFYENIFVGNNINYAIFWSCLVFTLGIIGYTLHQKIRPVFDRNYATIPLIGNITNVSHSIVMTPFWIGPVQTVLSIFGVFKLDSRGKCIGISLIFASLIPAQMQSSAGVATGALREIYYLLLIIPITASLGLFHILPLIEEKFRGRRKKIIATFILLLIFVPVILAPIFGSIYYSPKIAGTTNEKENLLWLNQIGNKYEGVADFEYRERIDTYAEKETPFINSGSEMRRYLSDLKAVYFTPNSENNVKDLFSFNIQYLIVSDRILRSLKAENKPLMIDSNPNLDKIFSSDGNFSYFKIIEGIPADGNLNASASKFIFIEPNSEIQDFGSVYLFENNYYKVKIRKQTPKIDFIGSKLVNLVGEGEFSDYITYSWRITETPEYTFSRFDELTYPDVSVDGNSISYKTTVYDKNQTQKIASLVVTYTFYEKALKREVLISNDRLNPDSGASLNVELGNEFFTPIKKFYFNSIENDVEKEIARKIFPSQDPVILDDIKFNEIYLEEENLGLNILYSDSAPYPRLISYMGSTMYDVGFLRISSGYHLAPSESVSFIQYYSVGDKSAAQRYVSEYESVAINDFPGGIIPVAIVTTLETDDDYDNVNNAIDQFNQRGIPVIIAADTPVNLQKNMSASSIGLATLYANNSFKNEQEQKAEFSKFEGNGIFFKNFRFNLNSMRAASELGYKYAFGVPVPSPIYSSYKEGFRNLKYSYIDGEKTNMIIVPVIIPTSAMLRVGYNERDAYQSWYNSLDSVIQDGGVAVFSWSPEDIGTEGFGDNFGTLVNYALKEGMTFTTLDELESHYNAIQEISTAVEKGSDYVKLNISNNNSFPVQGVTYKVLLPAIDDECPYCIRNGTISRLSRENETCIFYASLDIGAHENKELVIEPEIPRKRFGIDFSELYHGRNIFILLDDSGNPVPHAFVRVDAKTYTSSDTGKVDLYLRSGQHTISIEKPGFRGREVTIDVKNRFSKYIDL